MPKAKTIAGSIELPANEQPVFLLETDTWALITFSVANASDFNSAIMLSGARVATGSPALILGTMAWVLLAPQTKLFGATAAAGSRTLSWMGVTLPWVAEIEDLLERLKAILPPSAPTAPQKLPSMKGR